MSLKSPHFAYTIQEPCTSQFVQTIPLTTNHGRTCDLQSAGFLPWRWGRSGRTNRRTAARWCGLAPEVENGWSLNLGGHFKYEYELLNLRTLKIYIPIKYTPFNVYIPIKYTPFKIFCEEFLRVPMKFHIKYPTQTSKDFNTLELRLSCTNPSTYAFLECSIVHEWLTAKEHKHIEFGRKWVMSSFAD